jgi:hypothetical protein
MTHMTCAVAAQEGTSAAKAEGEIAHTQRLVMSLAKRECVLGKAHASEVCDQIEKGCGALILAEEVMTRLPRRNDPITMNLYFSQISGTLRFSDYVQWRVNG